jgi:hypothetical protein
LHAAGKLTPGLSRGLCRAPLLDGVVFVFTTLPQVAGVVLGVRLLGGAHGSWPGAGLGFLAGLLGQLLALWAWMRLHELANPKAMRGPRIKPTLNRVLGGGAVGAVRNAVGVWWTMLAVPIFTCVRLGELIVYPPLTWLVRLPKYDDAQWVNVTRHKFEGLVGSDRIWCLYCDWMTGVWSLGSEMLRNVESFWCPIRFASPEKCANCRLDFPDVETTWARGDGTMAEVTAVLDRHYPGPGGDNPWHGHPSRTPITVEGRSLGGKPGGG